MTKRQHLVPAVTMTITILGGVASYYLQAALSRPSTVPIVSEPIRVKSTGLNLATVNGHPLTQAVDLPKIDFTVDEPLPPEIEQQFFAEVEDVFSNKAAHYVNSDDFDSYLSALNARQRRGVRSLCNKLSAASQNDREAQAKMAYVDYLVYRAHWDEAIRSDLIAVATAPVETISNSRYLATRIAEDAELIKGMANIDFETTIKSVASLPDGTQRRYALSAIHDALFNQGLSWDAAVQKIAGYVPGYVRKTKA